MISLESLSRVKEIKATFNEQNITLHVHDARFSVGFFLRRCMTKNMKQMKLSNYC